tara:strand:+ start:1963 stop:2760 length:798 start_codon:yes stop_codon:yes gene_type:complete
MAISVDSVYKTVLLILNKEQRGYLTPDEFSKIATQVQLEIFEKYFEDLSQLMRVPNNDSEYGDRIKSIDEKLDIFKRYAPSLEYDNVTTPTSPYFLLPSDTYKLGTIVYNSETEVQPTQRNEFLLINRSKLTKPTTQQPVYILEDSAYNSSGDLCSTAYVYPSSITSTFSLVTSDGTSDISVSYIKKPNNVKWGYTLGGVGQFIYNISAYTPTNVQGSTDFELHETEQSEVVLKVLLYAGVVIRDPQLIAIASEQISKDEMSEKS